MCSKNPAQDLGFVLGEFSDSAIDRIMSDKCSFDPLVRVKKTNEAAY